MLSERALGKAVGDYVKKEDGDAITNMVEYQVKDTNKQLSGVSRSYYINYNPDVLWTTNN